MATGRYDPGLLERAFRGFVRTILPASEPSTRITFDDGSVLILLGGGPDSGALAGQAAFLLGARGAVSGATTVRQAVAGLFSHLSRETAEAAADNVIQELTGLPVGPSGLRRSKAAGGVETPKREVVKAKRKLRRPKLRKKTREAIEAAAEKTPEGEFIDGDTRTVIEGKFHYGHIEGREHRRLVVEAEKEGMTQQGFNDWVNDHPEWFKIQDPKSNLSHRFEKPGAD